MTAAILAGTLQQVPVDPEPLRIGATNRTGRAEARATVVVRAGSSTRG